MMRTEPLSALVLAAFTAFLLTFIAVLYAERIEADARYCPSGATGRTIAAAHGGPARVLAALRLAGDGTARCRERLR